MHPAKPKIGHRGTCASPRLQVFVAKGAVGHCIETFQQALTVNETPFLRKLDRVK